MDLNALFWNAPLNEMKKGYIFDQSTNTYRCLVCGKEFEPGRIYPVADLLYEAVKAVEVHITQDHGSMFEFLLKMNKEYTTLTDHQKKIMNDCYAGLSDKEISAKRGCSPSTVRNYRFNFREKEKQAKVVLAMMEILKEKDQTSPKLVDFHRSAKMVDERYAITQEEYRQIIQKYFKEGEEGPLSEFPLREKRRVAILKHIASRFKPEKSYSEKEVNQILKEIFGDYAIIRRSLIEYGFMERTPDGSAYWVKLS
ncbi:transcriptional regulator, LuxR family [Syntrophobotulus glycolicus DSM 8271]|uniref:Transcriptional regulator, LuxR family n=1 Tax=Syntrophobotulus glycolicus (strain DSM 8271 / FlGlyR) TaxID=645991 RepID=F0SY56_SYNGF|nr:DUF2087 domain-containing protein [Syntrophobotulus glycolicus]ADY54806.1 transcriptional regulator, LuxR family [Syntrophobotulus glycolicus DSM 8271]